MRNLSYSHFNYYQFEIYRSFEDFIHFSSPQNLIMIILGGLTESVTNMVLPGSIENDPVAHTYKELQ